MFYKRVYYSASNTFLLSSFAIIYLHSFTSSVHTASSVRSVSKEKLAPEPVIQAAESESDDVYEIIPGDELKPTPVERPPTPEYVPPPYGTDAATQTEDA